MLKPFLLYLSLAGLTVQTQATDLKIESIQIDGYVCTGTAIQIQFVLSNINVLPASGHTYHVQVRDASSTIVFQEEMPAAPIEPFTEQVITTYAEWIVEITGEYTVTASVDFIDDINTSNNSLSQTTSAIIPREQAQELFTLQLEGLDGCAPDWTSGFLRMIPLQPGDLLINEPVIEEVQFSLEIDSYKWMGYYDCDPTARYGKLGYYLIIDGVDSTSETIQSGSPMLINDEPYMTSITERDTTSERVFGTPDDIDTVTTSTITEPSSTPPPDPPVTCAILAGGEPNDEDEREAFRSDLEFMEGNLQLEKLGTQLDSNQIRFIGNATDSEICDAIDDVKNGYDKVIFYYTGHGNHTVNDSNRYGWMSTNGGVMLYSTLARKLSETSAGDICVIIDACFSGEAIATFKSWFGGPFKKKNITVITASSADTTALTRRVHQTANGEDIWLGFFSWNFVKCYGEPLANMDDDSTITFVEAFHWVREVNPMTSKGPMNETTDPQIWLCRVEPVQNSVELIEFKDTGCSAASNAEPAPDDSVSCSMGFNLDPDGYEWEDEEIITISPVRTWSLEWKKPTSYDLDLQFQYNLDFDDLDRADSMRVGVVKQDTMTGLWEIVPSELDEGTETVTVRNQVELGTYALALVSETVSRTGASSWRQKGPALIIAPNPVKDQMTLHYTLDAPAHVLLALFNSNGQRIAIVVDERQVKGHYEIPFNAGFLQPGVYQYVLRTGNLTSSGQWIRIE